MKVIAQTYHIGYILWSR